MRRYWLAMAFSLLALPSRADVITRLPSQDKVVTLTFDACEAPNRTQVLDEGIVQVLDHEKLPFTIFASGLFVRDNRARLEHLAHSPLVRIENHSWSHPQHLERLNAEAQMAQVAQTDAIIHDVTGRTPQFFRFPAGNYDADALARVEASGHRVVHWRVPSGDPTPGLTPDHLRQWVLSQTRPGDILIFHINGRAPATAQALPGIIAGLKARGFTFVRLDEALP